MKIFVLILLIYCYTYAQVKPTEVGGRIQAMATEEADTQDFFLRRVRVDLKYFPAEDQIVVFDVRNDRADQMDRGSGDFAIGDAFWRIYLDHSQTDYLQLFRGKVDVSYSLTSSSRHLFWPNRPGVVDHVDRFIVEERRASNVQVNGTIGNLVYHFAIAEGVHHTSLEDFEGNEAESIVGQKFTTGGKLRYYFFGDPKANKVQETYYGQEHSFSLGAGYFQNDKITYTYGAEEYSINRELINIELSYSNRNFRLLSEWFEFHGDLFSLDENRTGKSRGGYLQMEYVWDKIAPFILWEEFDRDINSQGYLQKVSGVGVNYYQKDGKQRFGIIYQKEDANTNLNISQNFQMTLYAMLSF